MAKTTTHADYTATALTLTTAAQPNITSVGTLTSFRSTGIDDNADALAITIDSSERVGIGTSSPSSLLHVAGTSGTLARIVGTNASSDVRLLFDAGGTTGQIQYAGASHASLADTLSLVTQADVRTVHAGTQRVTIKSNGDVGIGISPVAGASGSTTLHINSSNTTAYLRLTNSGTGSTTSDGFDLLMTSSDAYVWNREDGNIRFGVDNTEKMRLTDDGEIQLGTSIGNSTYAGQLNSVANLGSSGANIQTRNGDGNKHYILRGDNNVEYGSVGLTSPTGTGLLQIQGESGIAFRGASAADRMRIDSNGKVGIGTTNPQNYLTIAHDGHGLALDYVGSTLPAQAGLMTSSHAHVHQAYGDLVIKARSDYGPNYGIGLYTAGSANSPTRRMRIHPEGGIELTGNHQFNFRANGASDPGNGADIVFDAVQQGNAAGCYNTSTGGYQAAIDGWYMFSVGIRYDSFSGSANQYLRPQLRMLPDGGSTWQYPHTGGWVDPIFGVDIGSGDYVSICYTVPMYLSSGDQVRVFNNGNCTNSVNHNESHFGVIFMG